MRYQPRDELVCDGCGLTNLIDARFDLERRRPGFGDFYTLGESEIPLWSDWGMEPEDPEDDTFWYIAAWVNAYEGGSHEFRSGHEPRQRRIENGRTREFFAFTHHKFCGTAFRQCLIDIQKLDDRCPRPWAGACQKCKKYALDSSLNERAKGKDGLPDEASYPKVCLQMFALLPGPVVQVMSAHMITKLLESADLGKRISWTFHLLNGTKRKFSHAPDPRTVKKLKVNRIWISDRHWVPRVHYDGKTGCDNDEEILEFFQENPQPFDGSTPQKRRWQYRLTHPIGISADDRVLKLFEEHPEEARDAMKALWNLYREFTVSPTWENLIDRMGENKFNLLVSYNILKRIDLGYISRSSLYFYSDMRINSKNS